MLAVIMLLQKAARVWASVREHPGRVCSPHQDRGGCQRSCGMRGCLSNSDLRGHGSQQGSGSGSVMSNKRPQGYQSKCSQRQEMRQRPCLGVGMSGRGISGVLVT